MKSLLKNIRMLCLTGIVFVLAWPAAAQITGVKGNGKVTEQNRQVSGFSAVKVSCSADVFLQQGKSESVKVRADENLIGMIKTDVTGGTLEIDIDGSIRNAEVLEVYVTVTNLEKVIINGSGDVRSENTLEGVGFDIGVNGSGDVRLDLAVKNLETTINGSGDVRVSGVQGNFDLKVSGSGDFEADNLRLDQCKIRLNGSGDVKLNGNANKVEIEQSASGDVNLYNLASENVDVKSNGSGDIVLFVNGILKAKLMGSGDITYRGEPKSVDATASGSGEIYRK